MPFSNPFVPVNFINKSVTPTGTPDIDAAFLNYFQSIVDAQGDGLATYSSDLETLEATVTALGTPFTDSMYISGLIVEWSSVTQINITSGACYVPATSRIVEKTTATTINPTGLASNTWYYVYAIDTAGSLSFEYLPTTPVAYRGKAKQKSGDSSRRYVGSFRTFPTSTSIMKWRKSNNKVAWLENVGDNTNGFRVLVDGQANLSPGTVSVSRGVPSGCTLGQFHALNLSAFECRFGNSEDTVGLAASDWVHNVAPGGYASFDLPIDGSRNIEYKLAGDPPAGDGLYLGVQAYYEER